ncbi:MULTISPECIES: radical SAM protein [unclassified Thermosipho (in: thermotogales)]|uniref:radical SAM protein n=1 Tax=unclassified Thermosipho (in: thermotogales) TaxID=2676525 RepID=UPI0018CBF94F|nr:MULTISPECIES: radical SAM protein [unclassified Thermosipho (in: thermotogales)]
MGVNLVPLKTCNYSCVYCQLGKTNYFTNERKEYYPTEKIINELEYAIENTTLSIDYITFVGDGEPTLHSKIGRIIRWVREKTSFKVAVITNGSLLYLNEVRNDLLYADLVLPSIDAPDERKFRLINRPVMKIRYEEIIDGLKLFARNFKGKLWIEVMLMKDINDSKEDIDKISKIINSIFPIPERVYINVPIRPPAEKWVTIPDKRSLMYAQEKLPNAIPINFREKGKFDVNKYTNACEAISDITEKHPLRYDQAKEIAEYFGETIDKVLKKLQKEVKFVEYDNERYLKKLKNKNENTF